MAQSQRNINLWIFFGSLAGLLLANNMVIPLWDADESAYAGMAKVMHDTGNWLVQDFFMSDVHRKPPLHFWLMNLSYMIFGVNEWAVRFPAAMSVFGAGWILFFWLKKEKNVLYAQVSTGILLTNFLVLALAKVAFVDGHLVLATVLLGRSFYRIWNDQHRSLDIFYYWLAVAIGVLIKGPPILIFGGLLFLLSWIWKREWNMITRFKPFVGLPLAILPILLWGYFYSRHDGGAMISWMWDWYILRRASGEAVFAQTGPPGYYTLIMLATSIPYFVGFVLVLQSIFRKKWKSDPWFHFLCIWVISGWFLYEWIPSKLPTYTISAYPGLAMLIGYELCEVGADRWKNIWMRMGIFIQILLQAIVSAALIYLVQAELGYWGLFLAVLAGLTLLIGSIIYVLRLESGQFDRSPMVLVWCAFLFLYMLILPIMNQAIPRFECPRNVAESIMLDVDQEDEVLLAMEHDHMISVPFYLSREARLDQWRDPAISIKNANEKDYRIVIADSTFIPALEAKYSPRDTFHCWDMNTRRNQQYIILELK